MPTSPSYHGNFSDRDMPTLGTVAALFADARTILQDKIPDFRYDDASLIIALNVTMVETRRLRADFFVFDLEHNGQTQSFTEADDTQINIEPQFRPAILNGVIGHALLRDQEDVQDIRATSFLGMFYAGLIGRAVPGMAGGSGPGRQQGAGG